LEFDQADFGMTNLQTFGSNLVALSKSVPWEDLIEKVTTAPRALLGLNVPVMEAGESADLTLFDPQAEWVLNESTNKSKSKNNPWWGTTIKGKAVAVFNNSKSVIDVE
ncbi:MAG: dihydroorotase, partial [Cyclobacteriaceae bacterium]|nr:dihydroorotase [Cyclobacteriaceae bacterium]